MNPMSSSTGINTRPVHLPPPQPVARSASSDASQTANARGEASRAEDAARIAEKPVQEAAELAAEQRMRVEVEWHAASLSYVHKIVSPRTGKQVAQFPAAQVLDMVDDLMEQIAKG